MFRKPILHVAALLVMASLACGGLAGGTAGPTPAGGGAAGAGTPAGSASPAPRSALVSETENQVDAREIPDADWSAASTGQNLPAGGGVRTGDDSRARLDISDGTVVRIAPSTEFELTNLSPQAADPVTQLRLEAGKLFVRVTSALGGGAFEIETPAGVAAVRGSLMSAAYSRADGRLVVTCLEGECRLSDLARQTFVDLGEGERSEIPGPGQRPLPARLMELADLDDWQQNFPGVEDLIERVRQRIGPLAPTPSQPAGGAAAGQTACDHPYFPLRAGATWTYATDSGPSAWTVLSVDGDAQNATALLQMDASGLQMTWNIECSSSGLVTYQFGSMMSGQLGQFLDWQVEGDSGAWLPAADLLVPGYSWNQSFRILTQIAIPGQTEQFSTTSDSSSDYTVTGDSPVTVGDQTYPGLQISYTGTNVTEMQGPVSVPATEMQLSGIQVMARGVGLVRFTSVSSNYSGMMELTSFEIP